MQVKVCPKCGNENKPTSATCAKCYGSLDGVQITLSKEPAQPVMAQSPAAAPRPAPPAAVPPPFEQSPGQFPHPRPMGYPPNIQGLKPAKRQSSGSPAVAIILIILLLGAGGFAGWWFFLRTPSPEVVAQQVIDAMSAGDTVKFKSCLCQSSLNALPTGYDQQAAESMKKMAELCEYKIIGTTYEEDKAVVQMQTKLLSKLSPERQARIKANLGENADKSYLVMIKEDGKWKIDIEASDKRSRQAPPAQ